MANSIFAGTPAAEVDRNAAPLPPKQPSLIDLWTVEDAWQSEQEGWQIVASGNDGGKWAIIAAGSTLDGRILSDTEVREEDERLEKYVVERARASLRHWLAAVICRLIPVFPEHRP